MVDSVKPPGSVAKAELWFPPTATRTTVRPVTVATETVVGSFRCAQKGLEPSQILKQEKPFFPSRPRHPEDGRNRA